MDGRMVDVDASMQHISVLPDFRAPGDEIRIFAYSLQQWARDEDYGNRIFALERMTQREVIKALIDHYQPDSEKNDTGT